VRCDKHGNNPPKACALLFDLLERLASERSRVCRRPLAHSLALLCDRAASALLFGTLALVYGSQPLHGACFIGLGALDFAAAFFQARAAAPDAGGFGGGVRCVARPSVCFWELPRHERRRTYKCLAPPALQCAVAVDAALSIRATERAP